MCTGTLHQQVHGRARFRPRCQRDQGGALACRSARAACSMPISGKCEWQTNGPRTSHNQTPVDTSGGATWICSGWTRNYYPLPTSLPAISSETLFRERIAKPSFKFSTAPTAQKTKWQKAQGRPWAKTLKKKWQKKIKRWGSCVRSDRPATRRLGPAPKLD